MAKAAAPLTQAERDAFPRNLWLQYRGGAAIVTAVGEVAADGSDLLDVAAELPGEINGQAQGPAEWSVRPKNDFVAW